MASRFMTSAGNFFKNEVLEEFGAQNSHNNSKKLKSIDQKVTEALIEENRDLKALAEKQTQQLLELREDAETLQILEEEAQEENEVLKYKVMSLEAGARAENSDSLSEIDAIDTLNQAKKSL